MSWIRQNTIQVFSALRESDMSAINKNNKCGGSVVASANGFDVIECTNCGFKHVYPLPTDEKIENVYRHEYYSEEKPLYLERVQEDSDWWSQVYQGRYEIFEKNLESNQRTLLDIGSGPGLFLMSAKSRGWVAKGIEPNIKAAQYSQGLGLDVENIFFNEDSYFTLGKFDVINMGEVLEHISNPLELLQLARKCLNEDGLICIVVPNDFNPLQSILQGNFDYPAWWVSPPHHINYFNFNTLSMLLNSAGYEVIHKEGTFPLELFLLMGDNYIGNDQVGRESHKRRMNFEKAMSLSGNSDLMRRIYEYFADNGLGREVVMIARVIK